MWKGVAVAHARVEKVERVPAVVVVVGGCEGAGVGGQGCGGPAVADAVHVGDGAVVAAPLVVVQPIHRA